MTRLSFFFYFTSFKKNSVVLLIKYMLISDRMLWRPEGIESSLIILTMVLKKPYSSAHLIGYTKKNTDRRIWWWCARYRVIFLWYINTLDIDVRVVASQHLQNQIMREVVLNTKHVVYKWKNSRFTCSLCINKFNLQSALTILCCSDALCSFFICFQIFTKIEVLRYWGKLAFFGAGLIMLIVRN